MMFPLRWFDGELLIQIEAMIRIELLRVSYYRQACALNASLNIFIALNNL